MQRSIVTRIMSDPGCNKKPSVTTVLVNGLLIQTTATITVAQIRSVASTHGRDRPGYRHRLPTKKSIRSTPLKPTLAVTPLGGSTKCLDIS
jgi:hypothetical protein